MIFMQKYNNNKQNSVKIKNLKTSESDELGKGIPYWLPPIFVQACPHAYL